MAFKGERISIQRDYNTMLRELGTAAALFLFLMIGFGSLELTAAHDQQNCSFPAVYSFGDSLTDNGNAIAAFPAQFIASESNPNGVNFPHHAADRFCDGRLLIDYMGKIWPPLVLIHCIVCLHSVLVILDSLRNLDFGKLHRSFLNLEIIGYMNTAVAQIGYTS